MARLKQKHRRTERRLAATLVDLVVGMTGSAIVFGLSVAAVEQTMRMSTQAKVQSDHQQTMARLGQQLRADIQAGASFTVSADPVRLTIVRPDQGSINYVVSGATVNRESTGVGSQAATREVFRLARESSIRFAASDDQLLEMFIVRNSPAGERLESHVATRANRLNSLKTFTKEP